jgi:anaerobic selenocysteine-containing dehydrogenase
MRRTEVRAKHALALTATAALCAALAAGCGSEPAATPDAGGAETPEQLVVSRCTKCHDRSRIDAASHDAEGWARTIDRMLAKGARLSADERAALIEHLARR